jgi:hypothetical protein
MGKKRVDKKNALTFHVVHRSVQDDTGSIEGGAFYLQPAQAHIGPQHLPADFPNEVLHLANSQQRQQQPTASGHERFISALKEESFLSHDYDYSQHLRPMGGGVFIPAKVDESEDLLHVKDSNKLKAKTVDPRTLPPKKGNAGTYLTASRSAYVRFGVCI